MVGAPVGYATGYATGLLWPAASATPGIAGCDGGRDRGLRRLPSPLRSLLQHRGQAVDPIRSGLPSTGSRQTGSGGGTVTAGRASSSRRRWVRCVPRTGRTGGLVRGGCRFLLVRDGADQCHLPARRRKSSGRCSAPMASAWPRRPDLDGLDSWLSSPPEPGGGGELAFSGWHPRWCVSPPRGRWDRWLGQGGSWRRTSPRRWAGRASWSVSWSGFRTDEPLRGVWLDRSGPCLHPRRWGGGCDGRR